MKLKDLINLYLKNIISLVILEFLIKDIYDDSPEYRYIQWFLNDGTHEESELRTALTSIMESK